jgi:hypothetical protein
LYEYDKKEYVCLQVRQNFRFFVARKIHTVPLQGYNTSALMKKERYSFFILFVEIAAIVFLHSAKNREAEGKNMASAKKAAVTAPSYHLKALSYTKVK